MRFSPSILTTMTLRIKCVQYRCMRGRDFFRRFYKDTFSNVWMFCQSCYKNKIALDVIELTTKGQFQKVLRTVFNEQQTETSFCMSWWWDMHAT